MQDPVTTPLDLPTNPLHLIFALPTRPNTKYSPLWYIIIYWAHLILGAVGRFNTRERGGGFRKASLQIPQICCPKGPVTEQSGDLLCEFGYFNVKHVKNVYEISIRYLDP